MIELKNKKIGLVLSGGGAKGAYQVGMFRAMEELGLAGNITAMSGCSIGAYAAVIYAIRGNDAYRDFLYDFPSMLEEGNCLPEEITEASKQAVAAGEVSKKQFLEERRFWKYEALGLRRYIDALVSAGALERTGIRVNVCAYSLEQEKPVYFDLNALSDREKSAAIIGSGSLQYLFKPSAVRGEHFLDGGIIPEICTSPAPADKIPLKPLAEEETDFVLINFLIARDTVDLGLMPKGRDFLELRPSVPLEEYPGAGTLDFSPGKLKSHEEKGYRDTMDLLQANCIF